MIRWLLVAALVGGGVARAEPGLRPLVLGAGEVGADLTAEVHLAPNQVARPLSLAYDLWWGVTSRWTLGVIHSHRSLDRIDAGAGVCLREGVDRCARTYGNAGLAARWSWRTGPLSVAGHGRVLVRDVDPWKPAVTLGALVRWAPGRLVVASDPYLRIGLANRDRGNRDALVLPLWLGAQTARALVALHTGIDGELATWRDGWHVPIAIVARLRATDHLDLVVEAGFPSLIGPQNDHKQRAVMITVSWRSLRPPPR